MKHRIVAALAVIGLTATAAFAQHVTDRGVATSTLSSKPSKNTAKLDKALVKMFERYPAGVAPANN